MQLNLNIAIWNANGLSNHTNEVELFLKLHYIDLMLVSETHFTTRSFFKIRGYELITANHPDDRAHAGAAILIKSTIKYELLDVVREPFLQAACIKVICDQNSISFCAIYFPPRFSVKLPTFQNFFYKLGHRFFVAGDFNAKHPWWGSRIVNPKGSELYKCIVNNNYSVLSTGNPTYWPTDTTKIPDVLDFAVFSGISSQLLDIADIDELSSDHIPLIATLNTTFEPNTTNTIINGRTDLNSFSTWIERNINLNISLKTTSEIDDAVERLNYVIHKAGFLSTPKSPIQHNHNQILLTSEIRQLLLIKRRLRKRWQNSRDPNDKRIFNKAAKDLKIALYNMKNDQIGTYLSNLNTNNIKHNEFSLWNATKYIKRPTKRNAPVKDSSNVWCKTDKSKAEAFAHHLQNTFQPYANPNPFTDEINAFLDSSCPMDWPIKHVSPTEVKEEIKKLNCKKSPGYDGISGKAIQALPKKAILYITFIYNSMLRLTYFPSQWKCAEIIMINKPNKPEENLTSYRPISLLPIFSKIFERIFLKRLLPVLEKNNIIPDHQFGFRKKHGTLEQCHRIVAFIRDTLENKKYCSAVFLDVQQAFDKVWHDGLFFKLKKLLPTPFYLLLKSYLTKRNFYVKINSTFSQICDIQAGVPQGSVLGPILYTIFTSDIPISECALIATYADDTAILSADVCPNTASVLLQNELNAIETWLNKWNIKVNSEKSTHVTFSLRRGNCPEIRLNNNPIPQSDCVKYLGMHIDRRLTWKTHIKMKKQQLNIKTKRLFWLLGPKSRLSLRNKVLIYKAILKPVWTYGIQLWGTASNSNIEILQRYQSKTLRLIVNAPWFVSNFSIHNDLSIPKVIDEIRRFSENYLDRLIHHDNPLAIALLDDTNEINRLKRHHILDLPFRN